MAKLKDIESLDYIPQASTQKVSNNSPNVNLATINEVEGLLSQVNEKIHSLPIHPLRNKAFEEVNLFQSTTMYELRKAFE